MNYHGKWALSVSLLSLAWLASTAAWCQGSYFGESPAWIAATWRAWSCVAVGDVNRDGKLDMVCGNLYESSVLYLNREGTFGATPDWSSGRNDLLTNDIVLGDINGDGYLDLVCGNAGQSMLYLNDGRIFESTPVWISGQSNDTQGIALGDVDGDGDLDLVCGNHLESTTLYLNQGSTFESTPAWESGLASNTTSVALGDVDGDGDLDLICGNHYERTTMYLNQGAMFEMMPAWYSASETDFTQCVVLGDVNGDGALDLVCGNSESMTSLYLNQGGMFGAAPAWSAGLEDVTYSVALGDIDGDLDLDLVCGNAGYGPYGGSALFLNEGGIFGASPVWMPVRAENTPNVVLGDIDGNGALDLVNANSLYLNLEVMFATAPAWSSGLVDETISIALGDVEGDGDLDLVCGNDGNSRLYLSQGRMFGTMPAWSSARADNTVSVALGDIDRDGDLDLFCGNYFTWDEKSVAMYRYQPGWFFGSYPDWSSGRDDYPQSIALGDVNGDGYIDLLSGQDSRYATIYLNDGGQMGAAPSWLSDRADVSTSLALGDVNMDGTLDLLLGNVGQSTLYLNRSGIVETGPSWFSGRADATNDVELGDVDGDGDPDLICGNLEGSNTVYINQGGALGTMPAWISTLNEETQAITLGDIDFDGDLDLVCGNVGNISFYGNDGGMFAAMPTQVMPLDRVRDIALGDIDLDGDLDLVCGRNRVSSTLHLNQRGPAHWESGQVPSYTLVNNGAHISLARSVELGSDTRSIQFMAVDLESDPIWVVIEYQHKGELQWHSGIVGGNAQAIGPLATAPGGRAYSYEWDYHLLPFDERDVILRLRTIEIPRRMSLIQHSASYLLDVGPIEPHRPEISSSTNIIVFSVVTVGDTLSYDLSISNSGNEPLSITGIHPPSPEMRIDAVLPCTLDADEIVSVNVLLEPRHETNIGGNMTIESSDPLNPVSIVRIESDIRALQMKSRLLSTAQELPLGEAVTVVVTPLPQVRVERGYIYHRPGNGAGAFQDSVELSRYEDNFIATIPGAAVTEAGLEYFIKVENSGVFGTDPPGAPDDSVFSRAVAVPQSVTSAPQPNAGADFLEARDIKVQVSLPIGAEFVEGTLHHRRGGEAAYRSSPLEAGDPLPFAVIPDSLVGARGLEYWVEVQTFTSTLTDPPRTPDRLPHAIRVSVPDLVETRQYPERSYRMVTVPLDFGSEFAGTLEALLSDQAAFGPYDPVKWRAHRYLPAAKAYAELSGTTRQEFVPKPGRAFWLISASKNRIGTAPVRGLSTVTDSSFALVLEPGWNMIGNPFDFPVAWDSIMVGGVKMADAESTTVEPPIAWVVKSGYRLGEEILEPFGGYWVKNLSDAAVALRIPAEEAPPPPVLRDSTAVGALAASAPADDCWRLEIRAASCGAEDFGNYAGVDRGSATGWDRRDRSEPPMSPGRSLSLYFPHRSWERNGDDYAVDIRGGYEAVPAVELRLVAASEELWGHIWRFDVSKNFEEAGVGDVVTLVVSGIEGVPAEASVYLVDKYLGRCVDARAERSYAFYLGRREPVSETEARFALVVGSADFAESGENELPNPPERTVLHQNYPNPFNPSTIIRYDVAQECIVRLTVYDASGALVKVLYDGYRRPGRYEAAWNGRNENGRAVATGIYFSRLRTDSGIDETRKMLVMR